MKNLIPAAEDGSNPNMPKTPKSFVIRASEMTKAARQLVQDLRRVMEPNTASRLRVRCLLMTRSFIF